MESASGPSVRRALGAKRIKVAQRQSAWACRRKLIAWSVVAGVFTLLVLLAPLFAPHDPIAGELALMNQAPSGEYLLGTDYLGRCIACRAIWGARTSLLAALAITLICFVVGSVLGALSGSIGGAFDAVVMRITDAFMAFPAIVLSIAIAGMLGGGMANAVIALAVPGWTRFARLARGEVLSMKGRTFVLAERAAGASGFTIAVRHVLPNIMPALLVTAAVTVGNMILSLAGLSFLGLGAAPPAPELGSMVNLGAKDFALAPWAVFGPGAVILVMVMVFNLFGDAANDYLDSLR